MKPIAAAALVVAVILLHACGGGGDVTIKEADQQPAPVVEKPMEGFQPDGTLVPAPKPLPLPETAPETCRASERGVEHGRPAHCD